MSKTEMSSSGERNGGTVRFTEKVIVIIGGSFARTSIPMPDNWSLEDQV